MTPRQPTPLDLALWRAAAHAPDLVAFALEALEALEPEGITALAFWRCDLDARRLLRLALVGDLDPETLPGRLTLAAEPARDLRAWAEDTSAAPAALRALLPRGAAALLPLGPEPAGALVAPLASGATPSPHLLATLRDAATAALQSELRRRDLQVRSEAAEADRQALLTRLDRDSIAESVVGADSGLRHIMHLVEQVAGGDTPVLILGETGSGKEVIARALHERSARTRGPMVRVNCGAIPPALIDSELFGHERGAFTGAVAQRQGWFERADGGTLLLDEVGELPLEAQVRLLRVLQDGTFSRVGGHRILSVDVRVVAATHRDLETMVAEGRFREDLWYRLSVFPLRLPPLRERPEDIGPLAAFFAQRTGRRLSGVPLRLPPEALPLLLAYPWPGNARELAAVIERAAILGGGRELRVADALGMIRPLARALPTSPTHTPTPLPVAPAATLDDAIRRRILEALTTAQGTIEGPRGAAALLGVHPSTLRSRMKRLEIVWERFR